MGANGKLYLATEDGDVVVIRMGEKFEVIATNTLADQVFIANAPVIAGENLFLRGQNTLFCIGPELGLRERCAGFTERVPYSQRN